MQEEFKREKPLKKLPNFDRKVFDEFMKRRYFIEQSFSIYGGYKGLFDMGPPMVAVKTHVLTHWRNHFILEEDMLELECTCLTPEPILKTSGHVEKFTDFMVKDVKNGVCYRADKLLEEHLDNEIESNKKITQEQIKEYEKVMAQVDDFSGEELGNMLKKYGVKSPETGNDLTDPFPFNLMFATQIGPTGTQQGYLRPETAQGIFVNFGKLLKYNRDQMPFAGATIGTAFRNEIAPRSGLLRVREFTLAEIEHFVDPSDKNHPKFSSIENVVLPLYDRVNQLETQELVHIPIGEAIKRGIVGNQTLGYFLVRTMLFLYDCGVKPGMLRFRQHLENEMAHYASDCWDAELLTSYGWIECVGCADRACFDLTNHQNATNTKLSFFKGYPSPIEVERLKPEINKQLIGKTFKKDGPPLIQLISNLTSEEINVVHSNFEKNGNHEFKLNEQLFTITKEMVSFNKVKEKVTGETIVPSVIEPSFGIGRIIYSILEQNFYVRKEEKEPNKKEDETQRTVLSLPILVSPYKVALLPLLSDTQFDPLLNKITSLLKSNNISNTSDKSGATIGKRYVRMDEVGVPYAITVDHESLEKYTVTLRERDSTTQIRVPVDNLISILQSLINNSTNWKELSSTYNLIK
eukprot:TRINITY_DN132_c0_g5_i1.p1 TRINITY_DN132_c0_g5~~TRINITY_DN132_c0_g5_i1.p1  ORF type:complete len:634 (+),score=219.84 TRINITY_DN132_c0_g5_i1:52-1953(+)